jgi:SAM-dependent methyltransferase
VNVPIDWFDEDVAAGYDADCATEFSPDDIERAADTLFALSEGGPVLEFAIGTGRVALLLSSRGVNVSGIELSSAMVARLRAKAGGDEGSIPVSMGDMTFTRAEGCGTFRLVYLVYNTIMNLTTQHAQVRCFQNAADHLAPGGFFVVETMVPALRELPLGRTVVPFALTDTHIGVDEYDVVTQSLVSHHVQTHDDGSVTRSSLPCRYVWPAELDLMARLAGMRLRDRWRDWSQDPFDSESSAHVSVWQKMG